MKTNLAIVVIGIVAIFIFGHKAKTPTHAEVTAAVVERPKPALGSGGKLETLVDDYFETGFKMGYSCGARGGSLADAEFLLSAYRNGDTNAVIKWFGTHP